MQLFKRVSFRYSPKGRGGAHGWFSGFDLLGRRWGFDHSTAFADGEPYLERWIVYVNGWTLRLHKFFRGDDDRASHTHPWWFVTFPLTSYTEKVFKQGRLHTTRTVRRWRFHYRPADFEHYVVKRFDKYQRDYVRNQLHGIKPWWTIVLTGPKQDSWGFYPEPGKFINWKDYT